MKDGKTFTFASLTWKSLVEAREQGPEYRAFSQALLTPSCGRTPMRGSSPGSHYGHGSSRQRSASPRSSPWPS